MVKKKKMLFNLLSPMSDQDRISPYNIKQTSDENNERGLLVNPIPNSPN